MRQKIFTKAQHAKLVKNHETGLRSDEDHDPKPVIKLFNPIGTATWLLTEYDPNYQMFFGLADLGMQFPECGFVSRFELEEWSHPAGLTIERDLHWRATKTLSEYAADARRDGYISA